MRYLLLLPLCILLIGCKPDTIYITKYVTFEDYWLEDCRIIPPPTREELEVGNPFNILALVYMNQVEVNAECNIKLREAREANERAKQKNLESEESEGN